MRTKHIATTWLGLSLLAACGDSGGSTTPTETTTTTATDASTTAEDTSVAEDATAMDTSVSEDATAMDTSVAPDDVTDAATAEDTAAPVDTAVADDTTTTVLCACEGGRSCLEAKNPEACATLGATCGGGDMHRVEHCDAAEVEATCERDNVVTYHYWARIDGWLAGAEAACAGTLSGPAGVFTVATIPEPDGEPCSCQRTASACVELWGDGCAALTCDAGVQTAVCSDTGRLDGRCVTRDGQRELVFYGVSAALAETSCNGASVVDYYWFPAGL